jgi:spermidine/putrescine transport system ATP-binding protein
MLEVQNIWKNYEGQPLLCGVSFRVSMGETVCLLGASGSGKSTLLRIITGLEKSDLGQVLWKGDSLQGVPVHKRGFGLMFQDYALFPHRSVAQNVAFGLRMQSLPSREVAVRAQEALERVNMGGFANRRVTDLSGGEQQRVALARALAPRPRLLMLDEPLGALDRALKEELAGELRLLLHETQIPAIYVTHDQEEAFTIADRLILLHQGKIEQEGSPSSVYHEPASPWAANFLGFSNLLPGQILSTDPLRAQTEQGVFEGVWTANASQGAASSSEPGESVILLFRPGSARLEGQGTNRVEGVVEDRIFMGQGYRLRLRLSGGQLFSFLFDPAHVSLETFQPGQTVTLVMQREGVQFLKEAA